MPLQMTHGDEKKDSGRRRDILKEERTSERKTRQESEETNDKNQWCVVLYGSQTWATRKVDIKRLEAL